jgi:hypothetical protein
MAMRKMLVALALFGAVMIATPRTASAHVGIAIGLPGFGLSIGIPTPPLFIAPPVAYAPPVYPAYPAYYGPAYYGPTVYGYYGGGYYGGGYYRHPAYYHSHYYGHGWGYRGHY